MTFYEFEDDIKVQSAADSYIKRFGGGFYCEEPGDCLLYNQTGSNTYYTPHEGATAEQVIRDLTSGKPLSELWVISEDNYEPDADY